MSLRGGQNEVRSFCLSPTGNELLVADNSDEGVGTLWLAKAPFEKFELVWENGEAQILSALYDVSGRRIIVLGQDHVLRFLDPVSFEEQDILDLGGRSAPLSRASLSRDGSMLAVSHVEGNAVKVWNLVTRRLVTTINGHTGALTMKKFVGDKPLLAIGDKRGSTKIWDLDNSGRFFELPESETLSGWVYLTGGRLAARLRDEEGGTVFVGKHVLEKTDLIRESVPSPLMVYDPSVAGQPELWADGALFTAHGASNDGQWLVTLNEQREVWLWNVMTGRVIERLALPKRAQGEVFSLVVSDDGRRVAWAEMILSGASVDYPECRAWVWEVDTGEVRSLGEVRGGSVVLFSPGGDQLAQVSDQQGHRHVRFWDLQGDADQSVSRFNVIDPQYGIAYSPRNETFSMVGWLGMVSKIQFKPNGIEAQRFQAHAREGRALTYTKNGRVFFTAGEDQVVRAWESESDALLATFPRQNAPVNKLIVDREERWLGALLEDGPMTVWRIPSMDEIASSKEYLAARLRRAVSQGRWALGADVVEEMAAHRDVVPSWQLHVLAMSGEWERFEMVLTETLESFDDPQSVIDLAMFAEVLGLVSEDPDLELIRRLASRLYQPGDPLLVGLPLYQLTGVAQAYADYREGMGEKVLESIALMREHETNLVTSIRARLLSLESLALESLGRKQEARETLIRAREMFTLNAPKFSEHRTSQYTGDIIAFAAAYLLLVEAEETIEGEVTTTYGQQRFRSNP